jgi:hypothetical protein
LVAQGRVCACGCGDGRVDGVRKVHRCCEATKSDETGGSAASCSSVLATAENIVCETYRALVQTMESW